MLKQTLFVGALALTSALTVGCDDSSPAPASETKPAAPYSNATDATKGVMEQADAAGQDAMTQAKAMGDSMKTQGQSAMDDLKASANNTAKDVDAQAQGMMSNMSLDSLKEGMSLSAEQTDALIEKVKQLIGDGRMEQARTWVEKLETLNLPAGYGDKVTSLKNMLN